MGFLGADTIGQSDTISDILCGMVILDAMLTGVLKPFSFFGRNINTLSSWNLSKFGEENEHPQFLKLYNSGYFYDKITIFSSVSECVGDK